MKTGKRSTHETALLKQLWIGGIERSEFETKCSWQRKIASRRNSSNRSSCITHLPAKIRFHAVPVLLLDFNPSTWRHVAITGETRPCCPSASPLTDSTDWISPEDDPHHMVRSQTVPSRTRLRATARRTFFITFRVPVKSAFL